MKGAPECRVDDRLASGWSHLSKGGCILPRKLCNAAERERPGFHRASAGIEAEGSAGEDQDQGEASRSPSTKTGLGKKADMDKESHMYRIAWHLTAYTNVYIHLEIPFLRWKMIRRCYQTARETIAMCDATKVSGASLSSSTIPCPLPNGGARIHPPAAFLYSTYACLDVG